ncbi:ribonuclease H-like domain-containing protein [Tanacetum coccineum]
MDLETAQTNTTTKLPLLKQGEYEMWKLRIKQYFQVQDYALWDVIENGNSFKLVTRTTTNADGTSTSQILGLVTFDEKTQKKNDVKARSILLMALPNEHVLTFNQYEDVKTLFAAIQTRFGGNDATKKTLLNQMYENFSALSTKSLDSIFNRLQKIVSQLAILGEIISQEDLNLKFLRSLPSEWNTHVVVWRNKPDLDTMSFDDLYNNFKIVEQEVKGTANSSSSSSSHNMAFVSSPNSTNEVNNAYEVNAANIQVSTGSTQVSTASLSDTIVYAFLASQPNGSHLVHEDLEQIHEDDLEEMDLKWQLALLSLRTRRFFQKTGRKITINGSDTTGYDKSKVECFNCHKLGHFARECRAPRNQDSRNWNQDSSKRTVKVEDTFSKAMLAIDGAGFDWSYMADNEVPTNMALMDFSDSEDSEISELKRELEKLKQEKESNQLKIKNFDNASKSLDKLTGSQITDNSRKGVGFTSKSVNEDIYNEIRKFPDAPLVEELVSDAKLVKKTVFPTVSKIEFVRPQKQEKLVRKPVKYAEISFDHVQANCNYHQRERVVFGNNYTRVNYNYSAKKAHPSARRNMFPIAVLIKNGLRPLNTARHVNTAHTKTTVHSARPMSRISKIAPSTVRRLIQKKTTLSNRSFYQKVNIVKGNFNTARPRADNTVRPSPAVVNAIRGHLQKDDQRYVDSECSRHMTGNMSYLSDFIEFDGGYVTFGGGAKGGRITGKGTLKTGKLNFKDVYFVKELQFNLFSVLQMCDKRNSVLFTDTRCFVLSPDFKLANESQVLLKIPRKNNMYSVDLKNIIPKENLTCLVAKATLDESMLWHRRLGHISFKNINKLVKDNLVSSFPTTFFPLSSLFFSSFALLSLTLKLA